MISACLDIPGGPRWSSDRSASPHIETGATVAIQSDIRQVRLMKSVLFSLLE